MSEAEANAGDLALLALVVDSVLDYRVLAAWVGLGCKLKETLPAAAKRIAATCDMDESEVAASLTRLQTAKLLRDGGTTEIGLRWLHAAVSARLPKKRKGPAR